MVDFPDEEAKPQRSHRNFEQEEAELEAESDGDEEKQNAAAAYDSDGSDEEDEAPKAKAPKAKAAPAKAEAKPAKAPKAKAPPAKAVEAPPAAVKSRPATAEKPASAEKREKKASLTPKERRQQHKEKMESPETEPERRTVFISGPRLSMLARACWKLPAVFPLPPPHPLSSRRRHLQENGQKTAEQQVPQGRHHRVHQVESRRRHCRSVLQDHQGGHCGRLQAQPARAPRRDADGHALPAAGA